jgi:hypothetical protein
MPVRRFRLLAPLPVILWTLGLVVEAQQPGKPPRIGWLTSSVVHTSNVDAFRKGMRAPLAIRRSPSRSGPRPDRRIDSRPWQTSFSPSASRPS